MTTGAAVGVAVGAAVGAAVGRLVADAVGAFAVVAVEDREVAVAASGVGVETGGVSVGAAVQPASRDKANNPTSKCFIEPMGNVEPGPPFSGGR